MITKITTLCHLLLSYNSLLEDKSLRIGMSADFETGQIFLYVGKGLERNEIYKGLIDGAIALCASRICSLCPLSEFAADMLF